MESKNGKPTAAQLHSIKQIELSNLSSEELLSQLANSPCASRSVPIGQSLEEYLLRVEPVVQVDRLEPIQEAVAKPKKLAKRKSSKS